MERVVRVDSFGPFPAFRHFSTPSPHLPYRWAVVLPRIFGPLTDRQFGRVVHV